MNKKIRQYTGLAAALMRASPTVRSNFNRFRIAEFSSVVGENDWEELAEIIVPQSVHKGN